MSNAAESLRSNRVMHISTCCLAASAFLLAYPVVCGWFASSEAPRWFGRYSAFLLLFNVAGTLLLCGFLWAWRRARQVEVLFCGVLLSILPFGCNSLVALPGLVLAMWSLRFVSAFGLVVHAFAASRRGVRAPLALATGATLFALAVSDLVLFWVIHYHPRQSEESQPYRYPYDLSQITDRDLVLVGDSFVRGRGVPAGREFGMLMQVSQQVGGKVFNLGQSGTGPAQYLKSISNIPLACRSRRIIVGYYHNDMPAPEGVERRLQSFARSVGRGVPTFWFAGDMLAKNLTPTPHDYLRQLGENYSPQQPGHERRWALLRHQLELCFAAAQPRSIERPGFLIFPALLDFKAYPFAAAHREVGALAAGIGFEVFDSLEFFQNADVSAEDLWASSDDPHLNERGHQITAEFLSGRLQLGAENRK